MIYNLIISLTPILLSLAIGCLFGKRISENIRYKLVGYITFLVWLLLISIGYQFGSVLFDKKLGTTILFEASIYGTIITVITFVLLLGNKKVEKEKEKKLSDIIKPIIECLIAIFMVLCGMILYKILPESISSGSISSYLLYFLIFLVGIDLSTVKINSLTKNHFKVPLLTIFSLLLAAYITTFFSQRSFVELLVLGSGFGWFSLSGPLVGKILGAEQGSFALITDLIREFYAIGLLYLLGRKYSNSAIGICGATAMDSTLPFIKNNCSNIDVQIAIFSGFILTILAPFFIIIFSSFIV